MPYDRMQRVSRIKPCPVCNKPDWCLVAPDGSAAICQRVEQGSKKRCGDAGWLHVLSGNVHYVPYVHYRGVRRRRLQTVSVKPKEQCTLIRTLAQQYRGQITPDQLNELSEALGVSAKSLERLGVGWDGEAWTFPMSDGKDVIGIRRRFTNGSKVSVKGSSTGLFVPTGLSEGLLIITEGPSDCAAALDLGFDAIGRPSCNSRVDMTVKFARGRDEVVIIGDNDKPGRQGAETLASRLVLHCAVKLIFPPVKDLRQWLKNGLTPSKLAQEIESVEPIKLEYVNKS